MKRIPKLHDETKLQRAVSMWLNTKGRDYDDGWRGAYKDLEHGGCSSGIVNTLVYTADAARFYRRHAKEISAILAEYLNDTGSTLAEMFKDRWYNDDPLALDAQNQNLLAWFAFEETARVIETRMDDLEAVSPVPVEARQ
jgi:hypothetical protein